MLLKAIKVIIKRFLYLLCLLNPKNHIKLNDKRELNDVIKELNNYRPDADGTSIGSNTILEIKYDLQIVVPVYNVENYLVSCLESIINQDTQYKYQVILVDDGSKDSSRYKVDEYANRENFVVIHQQNKGLSGARNTGLKTIESRYISFIDSDDVVSPFYVEKMVGTALKYNADICQCELKRFYNDSELVLNKAIESKIKRRSNYELAGFAWGKVIKSDLFANLVFPEGYLFEDTMMLLRLLPNAKNNYIIEDELYFYRQNQASITHTFMNSPKAIDTIYVTKKMFEEANYIYEIGYLEKILYRQFKCNVSRLINVPDCIKRDVFLLSKEVYFNICNINNYNDKRLDRFFKKDKCNLYWKYLQYC